MKEPEFDSEPDMATIVSTIIAAALLWPVGLWLRENHADTVNDWYIQGVHWLVALFS